MDNDYVKYTLIGTAVTLTALGAYQYYNISKEGDNVKDDDNEDDNNKSGNANDKDKSN